MCGLVGVAGFIGLPQEKSFKELLVVDSIRGKHSTGVLFLPNSKRAKPKVVKAVGCGGEMLNNPYFTKNMHNWSALLLGHNRYATVGDVTPDNAHPFAKGGVIGAHNGTLTRQELLVDSDDFQVDSENIFHSIDKIGLEDTYEVLTGAWALSWYDCKKKSLNFVRNDKRPLHYCFGIAANTLYWASEEGMLEFILKRNGINHMGIRPMDTHTLYSINPRKVASGFTKTSLSPPGEKTNQFFNMQPNIPAVGSRVVIEDAVLVKSSTTGEWWLDGWNTPYQAWCTCPIAECQVDHIKALGDRLIGDFEGLGSYCNEFLIDSLSLKKRWSKVCKF